MLVWEKICVFLHDQGYKMLLIQFHFFPYSFTGEAHLVTVITDHQVGDAFEHGDIQNERCKKRIS